MLTIPETISYKIDPNNKLVPIVEVLINTLRQVVRTLIIKVLD